MTNIFENADVSNIIINYLPLEYQIIFYSCLSLKNKNKFRDCNVRTIIFNNLFKKDKKFKLFTYEYIMNLYKVFKKSSFNIKYFEIPYMTIDDLGILERKKQFLLTPSIIIDFQTFLHSEQILSLCIKFKKYKLFDYIYNKSFKKVSLMLPYIVQYIIKSGKMNKYNLDCLEYFKKLKHREDIEINFKYTTSELIELNKKAEANILYKCTKAFKLKKCINGDFIIKNLFNYHVIRKFKKQVFIHFDQMLIQVACAHNIDYRTIKLLFGLFDYSIHSIFESICTCDDLNYFVFLLENIKYSYQFQEIKKIYSYLKINDEYLMEILPGEKFKKVHFLFSYFFIMWNTSPPVFFSNMLKKKFGITEENINKICFDLIYEKLYQ